MGEAAREMEPIFVLRPGEKGDLPYVIKTWVGTDAWRPEARLMGVAHRAGHTRMVTRLLGRSDTVLTVAALPGESDVILGWSATRAPSVLLFVYVRKELRRQGMGAALIGHLPSGPYTYTHKPVDRHVRVREGSVFDPYQNWPE